MLAAHVPSENDEWLRFEMSKLTQCTRIFPLEPKPKEEENASEEAKEDEEEKEDNEDDNDGDNNNGTNEQPKPKVEETPAAPKAKSATYEEIMFQVFLQDRRQTMRLRCPLPNRTKAEAENNNSNNSSFLPPLENGGSSSRGSSLSSMVTTSLSFISFPRLRLRIPLN